MNKSSQLIQKVLSPWVLFMVLAIIVFSFFYVDKPLVECLSTFHLHQRFPILEWVTNLGNSKIYLVLFFVTALFFRYLKANVLWEQRAWFLWLCVALSNVVCGVVKVILGRARPDLWLQFHEYGFTLFKMDRLHMSFPSGHTTTMMSVVFGLAVLFPRYWVVLVLSGVLVALSRVLLLEHYLSDVLAATYLTLVVVPALVFVLRKKGIMKEIIWKEKR